MLHIFILKKGGRGFELLSLGEIEVSEPHFISSGSDPQSLWLLNVTTVTLLQLDQNVSQIYSQAKP